MKQELAYHLKLSNLVVDMEVDLEVDLGVDLV